ncbi:hypothetical protein GCM10011376_21030 [Nocardioides flavus (ex Wang et al. 2016)]|uniref:GerMN domain-containing protein n=1 Tax=Nocardioides flavus (ex Wang et al. 2016) TaxID=2058780 RepID=A0ABQ3HKQ5_9ACTN|nr:Gmad2 immunoglobulin-like domain-containing protein [Nocardioides flavus (ex Wang et al. 2016)]GHE17493.1 hypothetical protein GCM10011376_21030 [Nocardioides flavus (ex Wang et al. 2016)]
MTFPTLAARRVRRWASATAVVAAATLSLASCTGDGTRPASDDAPEPTATDDAQSSESPPASPSEPSASPTESPSESSAPDGTAVPVYWAGDGPGGRTVLFREFHRVEGDPLTEAARLVTSGQALDPDYRTLFPGGALKSVEATDGLLVVELADDGWSTPAEGMSRRDAKVAIQQLVYTLQGVQQERVPVQVLLGGEPTMLFGIDTTDPFTAASALRTLNLVSITSPAEGDTVTDDVLTVTGVANSFEASGPCRLLVDGVEMVVQPYQSEGWMEDRLFPFEVEFPLEGISGEVVVQCETDDPSGGTEGPGAAIDTKTITVQ